MSHITRDDIQQLAKLSRLAIRDTEIDALVKDFDTILAYVARLDEAAAHCNPETVSLATYSMRADIVVPCDPAALLAVAPAVEETSFVVPVIIKEKE